jgi:NADP-dependent 3-hydroxy acid dehydrogenase YdfG
MTNTSPATSGKVVLITGASSGIGEATARHLATKGHRIVLGARRTDRITAVAHKSYGRVDVLLNNAGVMPLSLVEELRVDEWNQMIDVNLRGVLHGIAAVLPIMRKRGAGHIVNVASVSAHRVDPTAAVYCATKFAVRALSEGLRQESKNLRVTVVSPGLTRSELADGIGNPQIRAGVRALMDQASIPATAIAEAIAYAIGQPDSVDVNELIVRPTAQG